MCVWRGVGARGRSDSAANPLNEGEMTAGPARTEQFGAVPTVELVSVLNLNEVMSSDNFTTEEAEC